MKAFVFEKPGKGSIKNVDLREIEDEEVLIKVERCGVCGTDFHIWRGTEPASQNVILGHEYGGKIIKVGKKAHGFYEGERVSVDPNISCNHCEYCKDAKPNLCTNLKALGVDIDGGFSEYSIVPFKQLYKIPNAVPIDDVALIEPLACCIHGIERLNINVGDKVLVIGGGTIGLIMVQLAKISGASKVILSEISDYKRKIAEELGADVTLNPQEEDLLDFLKKDELPDKVIESVGIPSTQEQAIKVSKRGGKILMFGCGPMGETFKVGSFEIYNNELSIIGSALNPFSHQKAVKMVIGRKINLEPLVTRRITLENLPSLLEKGGEKEDIKIVVEP